MNEARLAATDRDVLRIAEKARAQGRIGFDTEFLREKTYRARLCLVQVAAGGEIFLIDPLREVDLNPIAELLSNPSVQVVVHAGRQDFELFVERFGTAPSNVYDVQLAAGFAGYGASLPYGRLVESVLGIVLEKGEAYTDWCRRPLTERQLRYAADDVRYLERATEELTARLGELGRADWVAEEMRAFEGPDLYSSDPADAWRRVQGRGSLSGRQAAILRAVAQWREESAARRDVPRGWVIRDPSLVEIARKAPRSLSELKSIRGMNAREADRSGRELLAAVERGRSSPPIPSLPSPARSELARARMLSGLADAVIRARCERAHIAPELVANRADVEALIADAGSNDIDGDRHRLLRGWRRDLAGDAVLGLLRGRIGVRVVPAPPYLEEVQL